jgi:hypothetical protein
MLIDHRVNKGNTNYFYGRFRKVMNHELEEFLEIIFDDFNFGSGERKHLERMRMAEQLINRHYERIDNIFRVMKMFGTDPISWENRNNEP